MRILRDALLAPLKATAWLFYVSAISGGGKHERAKAIAGAIAGAGAGAIAGACAWMAIFLLVMVMVMVGLRRFRMGTDD